MKISDVLRGLIDVVDNHSDESPVVAGQEENTSFTGSLKPVTLPDVKSQVRVEKGETTPAGNAEQPEELFLPPLQMKMELLKKAVEVENIYDDGTPEQQEESRQEQDGEWTGPEHHYEYVGAQTGVVEGGSKDTTDKEESVSESIRNTLDRMSKIAEEKADKDYDEDGEVESEKDEVWGSRMKAAKKAGKMDEGCDDECQLDELSPKTLKSYLAKAEPSAQKHFDLATKAAGRAARGGSAESDRFMKHSEKFGKRKAGIDRAMDQLDEMCDDECQLDEAAGNNIELLQSIVADHAARPLKFDDGTSMKVDVQTADVILKVYAAVNADNQAKIERMVNKDKASFMRVVDFCWSKVGFKESCTMNELSKDTLKSYVKKANQDSWFQGRNFEKAADKGDQEGKKTANRKSWNRHLGIDRAMDRLEEEPMNELSPKTLKSYANKAAMDMRQHDIRSGYDIAKGNTNYRDVGWTKGDKRQIGIHRAMDRLEEEPMTEGRIDPVEAYEILDSLGLLGRDFFELSNDEVNDLMDHAKRLGYKSDRRTAPGSPARMFFQYLTRMADGVAKRRAARGIPSVDEDCGMSRLKELAGLGEGDDFDDDSFEPSSSDLGFDADEDYEDDYSDDLSDFGYQKDDDEELWEDKELKRIKELAVANKGINPVILDALTDDSPE